MKRALLAIGLTLYAITSSAALPACTKGIAQQYRLPVDALRAIYKQEGGYTGANVRNAGGRSYDRGLMQINTFWDPVLSKFGITPRQVRWNDCINVSIAAWILRQELNRFDNWRMAFAAYHAGDSSATRAYARRYAEQVIAHWATLDEYASR